MQAVILAGGFGSRLSELTHSIPKPMVQIGPYPILWHVMHIYSTHGIDDFIVACGYKGDVIKEFFHDYYVKSSDYVVDLRTGEHEVLESNSPPWRISMIDTGLHTMTGGRVLRLKDRLEDGTFAVTYGDGVGDIDITALLEFHRGHGKAATVTAVRPAARFGALDLDGDAVREFSEKPQTGGGWINGGFFLFEPRVFDFLQDDSTVLERGPLEQLARAGELMAYRHHGFWQPMDTLRDKRLLDGLWESGKAPWRSA